MRALPIISACVIALGMSQVVSALPITPGSGVLDTSRWVGNDNDTTTINAVISDSPGVPLPELYKSDYDDKAESGNLSGSYETAWILTGKLGDEEPTGASITYISGSYVGPTAYLLVKDGQQIPAWYLFDLTELGWNGTDALELSGFWEDTQGAISHVSLYGTSTGVPDGGATAALLGLGILGLGFMARRKA